MPPTKNSKAEAKKKIIRLWELLGAKVELMTVDKHDKVLAGISHLPHAIAFSLANSANPADLGFASGGFKDTTRIAASDSRLWADIFLSNSRYIADAIAVFRKNLSALEAALKRKDRSAIIRFLKSAARKRKTLP